MGDTLKPVTHEEFQAFLFQKRDEGIRFAPASHSLDTDGDDLYSYRHPDTGVVCAVVEIPRNNQGEVIDSEKVFYITE